VLGGPSLGRIAGADAVPRQAGETPNFVTPGGVDGVGELNVGPGDRVAGVVVVFRVKLGRRGGVAAVFDELALGTRGGERQVITRDPTYSFPPTA